MKNEIKEQLLNQTMSGMYIIEFNSGFKFGIAKNLNKRVRNYNKPWSQPINKVTLFPMDHKIATNIETTIKQYLFNKGLLRQEGSTEFVPADFKVKQEEIEIEINIYQRIQEELGIDG